MRHLLSFFLLASFAPMCGLFGQARPIEEPSLEAVSLPNWVENVTPDLQSPPPRSPGGLESGIYYRLVDEQANAETQERYFHYADEFTTAAGIHDFGELSIEFDPLHEELALHYIHVLRPTDDASTSREVVDLMKISRFRVVRPDDELSDGIFDGHSRLLIFLRDLRPGDVLEYAYTRKGDLPAFGDYFMDSFALRWSTSVWENRYRLVKSVDRPIFTRNFRSSLQPEKRALGEGLEEWVWKDYDLSPTLNESRTPAWYRSSEWVQLSQFESWREVATWGLPLYDHNKEPLSEPLQAALREIREAGVEEDQVMAAIHFVQDEIRYLGIEEGDRAFRPVSPNLVCSRRFGDCKDKTSLLRRLLQEIGVSSDPVYVSHRNQRAAADLHPTPLAFDHVVLKVTLSDGRVAYCDSTDSYQGGTFDTLPFGDFGVGLVVNADTTDLSELPGADPHRDFYEVMEQFDLGDVREPGRLHVTTTYHGSEAESVRYYLASTEPAVAERQYLDYYREHHPTVRSTEAIKVEDDRLANQLTVTESYLLDSPWAADDTSAGYYSIEFYLKPAREILSQPDIAEREAPYALGRSKRRSHQVIIKLPSLKEIPDDDWYFEDSQHFIETPSLEFRRNLLWDVDSETLTIESIIDQLSDSVSPSDMEDWIEKSNQVYALTSLEVWRYLSAEDPDEAEDVTSESIEHSPEGTTEAILGYLFSGILALVIFVGIGIAIGLTINRRRDAPSPPPLPPA